MEETNKLNKYKLNYTPQYAAKGTLDYAILEYLSEIEGEIKKGHFDSYNILTSLEGMLDNEQGENLQIEKTLVESLPKTGDIVVESQKDNDGNVGYFHVIKNIMDRMNSKIRERIYLNCRRQNIAKIAAKLTEEFDDLDDYYFKFSSDYQAERDYRTEQLVIYLKDHDEFEIIVQKIKDIKSQNPELFLGSNNKNPFLKNIDGYILYCNEPMETETSDKIQYVKLDGTRKRLDKSFNELLAAALEDCYIESMKSIVRNDPKINTRYANISSDKISMTFSKKLLPDILKDNTKRIDLIYKMKSNLKKACQNNKSLNIIGVEDTDSPEYKSNEEK